MRRAIRDGARSAATAAAFAVLLALAPAAAQADRFGGLVGIAPPPVKCGPAPCPFVDGSGAQQRTMANATTHEVTIRATGTPDSHVVRVGENITVSINGHPNSTSCQGFIPFADKVSFQNEGTSTATCIYRATAPTNFQDPSLAGSPSGPGYLIYDRFEGDQDHDFYAITPADRFELSGKVRVAGEPPAEPITVRIDDDGAPPALSTVTTNTLGDYGTTLAPGTYTVTPDADGTRPPSRTVNLSDHRRGVDFAIGDEDGDGLVDAWEISGVDIDGDQTIDLFLPAMGADPRHKDIFIEIDNMPGHAIAQGAVDDVVAAFAAAPVANPDGTTGIALHVDNGPGSIMNPRTGATWGQVSDAEEVPHADFVGAGDVHTYDWSDFDALKAGHFADARRRAFHYVLSTHDFPLDDGGRLFGVSRGAPASDILLTLGPLCPGHCDPPRRQQATIFMHELGHNLGLEHGGDDGFNYKPNYLSVMNYSFALNGLLLEAGGRVLDYDRYGERGINESDMDEGAGFGADPQSPAALFTTIFYCQSSRLTRTTTLAQAPVDLNCNGQIDGKTNGDVNRDGRVTFLLPHRDWENLSFTGGTIGLLKSPDLPTTTEVGEPTMAELIAAEEALTKPPDDPAGPGPLPDPTPLPSVITPPAIVAPPLGAARPSNAFTIASRIRRRRDGSIELTLAVPGPGRIDVLATARVASAAAVRRPRTITVARTRVSAARPGSVRVRLRPSRAARGLLRRAPTLKASVRVTFRPTGGSPATRAKTVTFRRARS